MKKQLIKTLWLDLSPDTASSPAKGWMTSGGPRVLEETGFPFEHLSDIAEMESWRKEINRPIYHIHKWWAQRLGSVFRAILLGASAPAGSDLMDMFYQPVRLDETIVFDPFMGSGTTIGEALKLGARAIGRDINPVAHFAVKNALTLHSRAQIIETFHAIEREIAETIRQYYRAQVPGGGSTDVLYYFWVKFVACPVCEHPVDLFASYVFAQHAYPAKNPTAQILCPHCGEINTNRYDADVVSCNNCDQKFKAGSGPARGTKGTCPKCKHVFSIASTVREYGEPPAHRLYAKLVLLPDGTKRYLRADSYDQELYESAVQALRRRKSAFPVVAIDPGYNTNQAINYCYRYWHEMFNERQLLCLSIFVERIKAIADESVRDLFACLFSGVLEFNNMFASYKGEGTGAVRHMFSHHILKPERVPLEANPWGTTKSSGSFSTLFESRLLRAIDYCEDPFELKISRGNGKLTAEKLYGLSCKLGYDISETFSEFSVARKQVYLSCGDSSRTDIRSESVDLVVTDPPFFDNVHYSQLADFFHVWQHFISGRNGHQTVHSTRSSAEVQASEAEVFAERLRGVWVECHRVLRRHGLLVFTYHHSRPDGWHAVLDALDQSGFAIVATHPIKAEMSVAAPKTQAKEPIDLDVIIVCRKQVEPSRTAATFASILTSARQEAADQVSRFNRVGRQLSRNDVRVVLMAQVIKQISRLGAVRAFLQNQDVHNDAIEGIITKIYDAQSLIKRASIGG